MKTPYRAKKAEVCLSVMNQNSNLAAGLKVALHLADGAGVMFGRNLSTDEELDISIRYVTVKFNRITNLY